MRGQAQRSDVQGQRGAAGWMGAAHTLQAGPVRADSAGCDEGARAPLTLSLAVADLVVVQGVGAQHAAQARLGGEGGAGSGVSAEAEGGVPT